MTPMQVHNRVSVVLTFTMAAAIGRTAVGQEVTIVVPSSAEGVDGDSFGAGVGPGSAQYLIRASEFVGMPETHRTIIGLAYRLDASQSVPPGLEQMEATWPSYELRLSTTDKDDLTTSFAANRGPDDTLVANGSFTWVYPATGPAGGPRDFSDPLRFQTPFHYDPDAGNLLVEGTLFEAASPSLRIDIQSTSYASITYSGVVENRTGVFGLVFVPEPSCAVLCLLGLLSLTPLRRASTIR